MNREMMIAGMVLVALSVGVVGGWFVRRLSAEEKAVTEVTDDDMMAACAELLGRAVE